MQLMIRVLIADDSAFMRKVLSDLFSSQPDFEVVGTARNGKEAIEKTRELHPDLLTMDVQMPVMDGLNALAVIMAECPLPVVMISSLTQEGTDETIRALSLGAVDFISKDGGQISRIDRISEDILRKCRAAAGAQVARNTGAFPPTSGTEKAPSRLLHLPSSRPKENGRSRRRKAGTPSGKSDRIRSFLCEKSMKASFGWGTKAGSRETAFLALTERTLL
jgi:two-component system chemotaxis response regulator CheB